MTLLIIIGILLGVILVYLSAIITLPFIKVQEQPISLSGEIESVPSCRHDVTFEVNGIQISGCLYLPEYFEKSIKEQIVFLKK